MFNMPSNTTMNRTAPIPTAPWNTSNTELREAFVLRQILLGKYSMTTPEITLSNRHDSSDHQSLNSYNDSVSEVRANVLHNGWGEDGIPWKDHIFRYFGYFQIRTLPAVNYFRLYSCEFAREDSFKNYVTIGDEEFDLPPTSREGLSLADHAVLSACTFISQDEKCVPENGLTEHHSISVIQFFVKNVVAGSDEVVTPDNERFSTWGVSTSRVRAFSYDPSFIVAAINLLEAMKNGDETLESKVEIAFRYIRYLEVQLGVLQVSEVNMNTELYAEILYYTHLLSRVTKQFGNSSALLPKWFYDMDDNHDVRKRVDLSETIYDRYSKLQAESETKADLQSSDQTDSGPSSKLQTIEIPSTPEGENASKDTEKGSSCTFELLRQSDNDWLWKRLQRTKEKWSKDSQPSPNLFEQADIPSGRRFTVHALRELLYNPYFYCTVGDPNRAIQTAIGATTNRGFNFYHHGIAQTGSSFTLYGCSLHHLLQVLMIKLSNNSYLNASFSEAIADCLAIIASSEEASPETVASSVGAQLTLQCYQTFVSPILEDAAKEISTFHEVRYDVAGLVGYVRKRFYEIMAVYKANITDKVGSSHQAVGVRLDQMYDGPDIDFKVYTVRKCKSRPHFLSTSPERGLSVRMGSHTFKLSISRKGKISFSTLGRLSAWLPDEVEVRPPFTGAKWILPKDTNWTSDIADRILSGEFSTKAAVWLYNNVLRGRVPINTKSSFTSGIPKVALTENGYILMRPPSRKLFSEIPHVLSPITKATYMTPFKNGNVFKLVYEPRRGMIRLIELSELEEDIDSVKLAFVDYWTKAG